MPIKNISDIEKILKLQEGTLKTALENQEEIEIKIPDLVVRTKEEESTFLSNIELEKTKQFKDGTETAEKNIIKGALEKFGLTNALENKAKTFENFVPILKDHIIKEAGIQPDKKIKELESDLEKMRGNYNNLEGQFTTYKSDIEKKEKERELDSIIFNAIPDTGKYLIPRSEIMLLVKTKQKFGIDNNMPVGFDNTGQVIKNPTTLQPLSVIEIVTPLIKQYMKGVEGGSGEGDNPGRKNIQGGYESFVEEMKAKNIHEGSEAFQVEMSDRINKKTLII